MIFFHSAEEASAGISNRIPWLSFCLEALPSINFSFGDTVISEGIKVKAVEYQTARPTRCIFETHRDHIDVQVCLEGEERILLTRRAELSGAGEWDEKGDVIFYDNPEGGTDSISMRPGSVLVLFPEDAHRCGEAFSEKPVGLKKFVFKVHRDLW